MMTLAKNEILRLIHDAIVAFDEEKTVKLCKQSLAEGLDAYETIMSGLAKGMETVGSMYEKKEYFVPELLLCSDALYAGLDILKPHVKVGSDRKRTGRIIIGVVEGDIHDIGKNLLKTMFEAGGWEINDLGKDVKLQRFVDEQKQFQADVVAISALMTTSMLAMPKAIKLLKESSATVMVMVGGAPLSLEIAKQYGADGYASDAVSAVEEAKRLTQGRS